MSVQNAMDAMKQAQAKPIVDDVQKAFTQSASPTTGLTAYDLEAPAKTLYPGPITPLRNRIARVGGGKGTAVNWKAITGINVNALAGGVSEGNRGGVIATSTSDVLAAYKGIGFEDYVTFEADYAANGFDDVRARAVLGLLRSLMNYEEKILLGGNGSQLLGTTPTPTVANATTGGTIAAATYNVACVALTMEGFLNSSLAAGVPAAVSRTNSDGSTDNYGGGSAQKSATSPTTTTTGTSVVTATVAPVKGAYGYAWFIGTAGAEKLAALTTINSVSIAALPGATQALSALPASDNSKNQLVFDGLLTQCFGSGALTSLLNIGTTATLFTASSGALVGQMATGTAGTGQALTGDGAGGIVEIDALLKAWWDLYRLSPDTMYVNSQEALNIGKKILANGAAGSQRFNFQASQNGVVGGIAVKGYLNKFALDGPQELAIKLHPNLPPGTIAFYSDSIPYQGSNVPNPAQVQTRREYYQLEWPLRTRKYEYGVYADEVLKLYAPFAFGALTNIANG
jgi:hypothetical protein